MEMGKDYDEVTMIEAGHAANAGGGQRTFANAASFFAARSEVATREVQFPEKGGVWLRFRAITQKELNAANRESTTYDTRTGIRTPERDKDFNRLIFIRGAVTNEGTPVFAGDFAERQAYKDLGDEPFSVVNRGATAVADLSGISADALAKESAKNASAETEGDDET